MTYCIEAASNLKVYQYADFINGVSMKDNAVPLGIGFIDWQPIQNLNLTAPPPIVSDKTK